MVRPTEDDLMAVGVEEIVVMTGCDNSSQVRIRAIEVARS
jgi:hypothetical protein